MEGQITEEELEWNSEAGAEDVEVAVGSEIEETRGLESSAMEVDNGGESEVVAVEKGKQSGGWKWVLSSPPKQSRKRACATMATQTTMGSQAKTESMGSGGIGCDQCVQQGIACVVVDGGTRCTNCKAKHYRCSLVMEKEGMGGKGSLAGLQQVKAAAGSQTRGKARRGKGVKGAALGGLTLGECVLVLPIRGLNIL